MKDKKTYQKLGIISGALIVLVFMFILFLSFGKENDNEKINDENVFKVLNTGKSDCVLIKTQKLVILNDTADTDDYELISEELDNYGIKKIDYIICSHLDKDHIGSAAKLIKNYEVGTIIMPDYKTNSTEYTSMIAAAKEKNITVQKLTRDMMISLGDGSILISAPQKEEYKDENNYSLILDVEYNQKSILLMGDALKERTQEFIDSYGIKKYNIIKMPHHGTYYKLLKDILSGATPELVIFTVSDDEFVEEKMYEVLEEFEINYKCTCDGEVENMFE